MAKEHVEKVYKSGRDMFVYTTDRVILMNVQGLTGKKVEYLVRHFCFGIVRSRDPVQLMDINFQTIPHKWIHGFEVETAGHMDRDAEVYLKTDIPQKANIQQDILVNRGDGTFLQ
jgi:hypothetical protein